MGLEEFRWLLGTSFPQVPSEIFKLKVGRLDLIVILYGLMDFAGRDEGC